MNPPIGIILCEEKNASIAKYSVLSDKDNLIASEYMLYLPTEEELAAVIEREKRILKQAAREKQMGQDGGNYESD